MSGLQEIPSGATMGEMIGWLSAVTHIDTADMVAATVIIGLENGHVAVIPAVFRGDDKPSFGVTMLLLTSAIDHVVKSVPEPDW